MTEIRLCHLDDIEDGGSAGFTIERDGRPEAVLAVRLGRIVYAYVNRCPHVGLPLDFVPGRFLNRRRDLIQCSTHGALFRIEDGDCVAGPCAGKGLTPLRVRTQTNGMVVLLTTVPG